jgi:hypothetical protein
LGKEIRRTNSEIIDHCGVCERLGDAGGQPMILSVTAVSLSIDKHIQLFDNAYAPNPGTPGPGPASPSPHSHPHPHPERRLSANARRPHPHGAPTSRPPSTASASASAGAAASASIPGGIGGERCAAADFSRTWVVAVPRGVVGAELSDGMARPTATAYILTQMPAASAQGEGAGAGMAVVRLGLHAHGSVLAQRGGASLGRVEERLVLLQSGAMDVDMGLGLGADGVADDRAAGVLEYIGAQYAAQSWLAMGPLAADRYSMPPPRRHTILQHAVRAWPIHSFIHPCITRSLYLQAVHAPAALCGTCAAMWAVVRPRRYPAPPVRCSRQQPMILPTCYIFMYTYVIFPIRIEYV